MKFEGPLFFEQNCRDEYEKYRLFKDRTCFIYRDLQCRIYRHGKMKNKKLLRIAVVVLIKARAVSYSITRHETEPECNVCSSSHENLRKRARDAAIRKNTWQIDYCISGRALKLRYANCYALASYAYDLSVHLRGRLSASYEWHRMWNNKRAVVGIYALWLNLPTYVSRWVHVWGRTPTRTSAYANCRRLIFSTS